MTLFLTEKAGLFEITDTGYLWRCKVPVVPGADGALDRALGERTARCEHRTRHFVGLVPTCAHHLRTVSPVLGIQFGEIVERVSVPLGCDA